MSGEPRSGRERLHAAPEFWPPCPPFHVHLKSYYQSCKQCFKLPCSIIPWFVFLGREPHIVQLSIHRRVTVYHPVVTV